MAGKISADALFMGLTRPPMFLGVSYTYALLNGMICSIYFINYTSFLAFVFMVLVHMVGYALSFHEPLFLEILMMKAQQFSRCKNKIYHGANSYDVY